MNPISEKVKAYGEFPPMNTVRRELNIDWYRCPIDRKVLTELIKKDDVKGLFQAGGHLGLWCTTAALSFYFFNQSNWVGFFILLMLHGIVGSHLTAPHHELCHRTVFKTLWLNEAFLRIFSIIGWLNFRVYRFSHNYHHRYTLFLEGDREEIMPATPSLRALYLLQLFSFNVTGGYQSRGFIPTVTGVYSLATNKFDNPFNSWGPELYAGHDKQRHKAASHARATLFFHAIVVLFSIATGHPILILIISGSVFIANFHRYFVGVPQHCGLRSNVSDFRKCARSIKLDPLSSFLYWHMNWHLEHHMYAAVPCYNLKKLHHVLASDMPEVRTLSSAWKEMRATWYKQKTNPDYAFDTPVPTPTGLNEINAISSAGDELASSVGDLASKELEEG